MGGPGFSTAIAPTNHISRRWRMRSVIGEAFGREMTTFTRGRLRPSDIVRAERRPRRGDERL